MRAFSEKDMYAPVKKYFEGKGYTMRAEVKNIDAAAEREGELILFEFKKSFNMTLLYQALDRQKVSEQVYVVIPKQSKRGGEPSKTRRIVKALGLGLITIAMNEPERTVEIVEEPRPARRINNKRTRSVLKEIDGRHIDGNKAGSVNEKLLTAYRERCIRIACMLYKHGELSPKQLRELGCGSDTAAILRLNYYGWFYPVKKNVYFLTDSGFSEIEDGAFQEAVRIYL